jgi:hypothetical protein
MTRHNPNSFTVCLTVVILSMVTLVSYAKDRTATLPDGTQVLLRDNGTWEEIEGSVGGHPIRCQYWGDYSGIIVYAQPFTSKNEFFSKHPNGKYSLSGQAIIDGKDLDAEIPISYIAVKNGNTWDVLEEGLNERMGHAGDGDTRKQIGSLPKITCLIDTIIPK